MDWNYRGNHFVDCNFYTNNTDLHYVTKVEKNIKAKWITIVNSNMVEIGFICFCIFIFFAIGGAFCDSELGRIILNK